MPYLQRIFLIGVLLLNFLVLQFLYFTGERNDSVSKVLLSHKSLEVVRTANKEVIQNWRKTKVIHLSNHLNVDKLRDNFYITDFAYRSRDKISYFHDLNVSLWQPLPYYAAAELARRYGVRHIIDLGCGKSYKLAKLYPEFVTIGIDFKDNIEYSRKVYPHLRFEEINAEANESSCSVDIDEAILSDSVILSSDVIEHIYNPIPCYLKLLRDFMNFSKALVISTIDREVSDPLSHGPPVNPAHVREWKLSELEVLLIDNGFYPVIGGRGCPIFLYCAQHFLTERHGLMNIVITTRNSRVGEKWVSGQVPDIPGKLKVFLIMHNATQIFLLEENIYHLIHHGVDEIFILVPKFFFDFDKLVISIGDLSAYQSMIKVLRFSGDVRNVVSMAMQRARTSDWLILTDAHEFVFPIRDASVDSVRLRDFISLADYEGFNSVAVTTVFTHTAKGKLIEHGENEAKYLRIFGHGPWNDPKRGRVLDFTRHVPVFADRIRVWKGNRPEVDFDFVSTPLESLVITGVNFDGMLVYPYALYSQRVHPSLHIMLSDATPVLQQTVYSY